MIPGPHCVAVVLAYQRPCVQPSTSWLELEQIRFNGGVLTHLLIKQARVYKSLPCFTHNYN